MAAQKEVRRMSGPCVTPEDVERLIAALESDRAELPDDVRTWLREGATRLMATPGCVSLDECLGITAQPGAKSPVGQARRKRRNAHIWNALQLADSSAHTMSPGKLLLLVDTVVGGFNRTIWTAWSDLDAPPEGASTVNAELWKAAKLHGRALPSTGKHLLAAMAVDDQKKPPEETFQDSIFLPQKLAPSKRETNLKGKRNGSFATDSAEAQPGGRRTAGAG
jgi:hypothetical protein